MSQADREKWNAKYCERAERAAPLAFVTGLGPLLPHQAAEEPRRPDREAQLQGRALLGLREGGKAAIKASAIR
jgi:hypothetical protein